MMDKRRTIAFAFAGLLTAGVSGVAMAKERHDEGNDAAALANAKVPLSQAIATAEQRASGKAVGAGVDNENGTVRMAVEVATNQGVRTVLVDPWSG